MNRNGRLRLLTVAALTAVALFAASAGPASAQHGNPPPAPAPVPPPPPACAPTISSFTPTSGPVGTTVTITGTNFTGTNAVIVGAVSAPFTVVSPTTITAAVVPGAGSGAVAVISQNPLCGSATSGGTTVGGALLPGSFTVTVPGAPPRPPPPPPPPAGTAFSLTITTGVINSIGQQIFPLSSVQPIVNQLL